MWCRVGFVVKLVISYRRSEELFGTSASIFTSPEDHATSRCRPEDLAGHLHVTKLHLSPTIGCTVPLSITTTGLAFAVGVRESDVSQVGSGLIGKWK
jgi:hypothetical protein